MRKRFACATAAALAVVCLSGTAARSAVFTYAVTLNAQSEFPSIPSGTGTGQSIGSGTGTIIYDDVAHTLGLSVNFANLSGTTTNSHIHALTATSGLGGDAAASAAMNAGVATTTPTFAGFPMGVQSGSFSNTLDLTLASSWNAAFVTAQGGTLAGAEAALAGALASGRAYWNIHSSLFAGGEIRGFPRLIPEPATMSLAGLSLLALAARRRRS